MSLRDELGRDPPPLATPKGARPAPEVIITDGQAEVTTKVYEGNPDHAELLAASDLSPDEWHIVGDVQVRRWQQTEDGPWLRYFKFTARSGKPLSDPGWEDAIKRISKHKPKKPKARTDATRIICLSDTQIGKGEGGGSEALAARIEHVLDECVARVKAEKPSRVVVAGMGDIVEGCFGSYPSQPHSIDLDRRQQERFARRMILAFIEALAPLVPELEILCVPGNHGVNRGPSGKSDIFTTPGDNADVAVFEAVAEACALSPAYKHVEFIIPHDEDVVVRKYADTVIAFAHGHQFGRGATPQQKALNWWKGQAAGRLPAGEADVLVTAHFHHINMCESHGRLWVQCPSIDGGSRWFTGQTGEWSHPGIVSFVISPEGIGAIDLINAPAVA